MDVIEISSGDEHGAGIETGPNRTTQNTHFASRGKGQKRIVSNHLRPPGLARSPTAHNQKKRQARRSDIRPQRMTINATSSLSQRQSNTQTQRGVRKSRYIEPSVFNESQEQFEALSDAKYAIWFKHPLSRHPALSANHLRIPMRERPRANPITTLKRSKEKQGGRIRKLDIAGFDDADFNLPPLLPSEASRTGKSFHMMKKTTAPRKFHAPKIITRPRRQAPRRHMRTSQGSKKIESDESTESREGSPIHGKDPNIRVKRRKKALFVSSSSSSSEEDKQVRVRKKTASSVKATSPRRASERTRPFDDDFEIEYTDRGPTPLPLSPRRMRKHLRPSQSSAPEAYQPEGFPFDAETGMEMGEDLAVEAAPPVELVAAFERLSLETPDVSSRPPASPVFLRRNARQVFERRAEKGFQGGSNRATSMASSVTLNNPRPRGLEIHDERILRVELVSLTSPLTAAPSSMFVDFQLEFKSAPLGGVGTPLRIDLGRKHLRLPWSNISNSTDFLPCTTFDLSSLNVHVVSEPICFQTDIPRSHSAEHVDLVVSLYRFRTSADKPTTWKASANPLMKGSNKGEVRINLVQQGMNFIPSGMQSLEPRWLRQVQGKQKELIEGTDRSFAEIGIEWTARKCYRPRRSPPKPPQPLGQLVSFEYRISIRQNLGSDEASRSVVQRWRTHSRGLHCPLCNVFGPFSKADYLELHLKEQHKDVSVQFIRDVQSLLLVISLINRPPPRSSSSPLSASSRSGSPDAGSVEKTPPPATFVPALLATPSVAIKGQVQSTQVTTKIKEEDTTPTKPRVRPEWFDIYHRREPQRIDILDELPLDHFGNQANRILAKENEIYGLVQMKEEDRIVAALWSRWILLNRSAFLSDYFKGVTSFLETYNQYIHKAANLTALRSWLLTLVGFNFLTMKDVPKLMLYYTGLLSRPSSPGSVHG